MLDNSNRKLAAIMFADIVSYSRLMGSNEREALKLLNDFEFISKNIVEQFNGIILKKNGDQIFCEFASAKNAVDGSLKLQKELNKYNDSRPKDFKLEIRIGVHIGDVVKREDGDIHGDGVNVAARIQPLASPGGICVSGAVSDALTSHPGYDVIAKGEQELKNILQKHSIYQVKTGYEIVEPESAIKLKNKVSNTQYWIVGLFILVAGLCIFFKLNINLLIDDRVKAKRVLIAEITSNDENIEFANNKLFDDSNSSQILKILSNEEKYSIYDQLISALNMKRKNEWLYYFTKFQ